MAYEVVEPALWRHCPNERVHEAHWWTAPNGGVYLCHGRLLNADGTTSPAGGY